MKRLSLSLLSRLIGAASILALTAYLAVPAAASPKPAIQFLGKTYRLGSYNQKDKPMWEFTTSTESVDDWTTLVTVIDRPDAASLTNLDRLAQGTMQAFQSGGAKILMARTMRDPSGKPYDYLVAAFDEADKQRYELNFAKIALGPKHAYILIYAARISGSDYKSKAVKFLDDHSGAIGKALNAEPAPGIAAYPRTPF